MYADEWGRNGAEDPETIAVVFPRKFRSRIGMRRTPTNSTPGNVAQYARSGRTRERERGHGEYEGEHGGLPPNEE